ncbi:S8 family serine peptidase [Cognatishimia sp. F0-27]|nr:S8 family serine peptidase [Cognatishimia sp. F0-27]
MVPVDLPADVSGAAAIDALEADVTTATVGVNHAYRLQSLPSVTDRRNYATTLMRWPEGGCRATGAIGLIDGGVEPSADGLSGARLSQRQFGAGSPAGLRHGTEVASLLADPRRLRNVALYSAAVLTETPDGDTRAGASALVQALDWLAAQDVRVVNISLAGPPNKLLARAVSAASERGMTIVAAAGNDRRVAATQYPAALPGVLAVTAVDARGAAMPRAVRGSHIDFAAPGVDVFVQSPFGARYVSGTSIAAPLVTARLAAGAPLDYAKLASGAIDLGREGKDPVFGHGLVQAAAACPAAPSDRVVN